MRLTTSIAMTPTQEEAVLVKSIDLIEKVSGKKPRGYVAPWWEMSNSTADLLLKYGFTYDHSQGYRDFQPFYARVGKRAFRILNQRGYARMDFRLTEDNRLYFLEANPNPQLAYGEDFAESAHKAGVKYPDLIERILRLGLEAPVLA